MENTSQATPESVWAAFRETDKKIKELAEQQAETDRQRKENERFLIERFAETDRKIQKVSETVGLRQAQTDRQIQKVNETLGSWAYNHGRFAEDYFFNSFEAGKSNFFGEKFDEIEKNVKGFKKDFKDEYDILLINGQSIGIVEVKYKAHENDIPDVLKKAQTFRINFPEYANHRVYLGLATMSFYPELEQACINEGIAIVKQVGDTVVINDKHLKVF